MEVSDKIKCLETQDLERYIKKLTVTVDNKSIVVTDPYLLKTGWISDPTQIPPTQYACIYNYLINAPGPFDGAALQAYKSLEAYNYFVSGHVKEVILHCIYIYIYIFFFLRSVLIQYELLLFYIVIIGHLNPT